MRLHLLGIPHTVSNDAASHCAFTGKVQKFPAMIAHAPGYEVIHYGVEGAETAAAEHVTLMSRAEQDALRGHDGSDPQKFVGDDGNTASPLYREFNRRLRAALLDRVTMRDLVLLPFGHGHSEAVRDLPFTMVESGIGYPELYAGAQFKIFESYAWMHFHQGRENRNGKHYEWAIPNYFDTSAWALRAKPSEPGRIVYFGRLCELKGLQVVVECAKQRPDLDFVLCGQGDPTPYLREPNITYQPPLHGAARSALLGSASAVLMPSLFTEPFGGVAVEAQLCGTPVISTAFGAFTETIEDEVTGFRCHTLGDFLAALERMDELKRTYISARARRLYGYARVAQLYDRAFTMIADLQEDGWYSTRSFFRRTTR